MILGPSGRKNHVDGGDPSKVLEKKIREKKMII
jgi:hypothetical protein